MTVLSNCQKDLINLQKITSLSQPVSEAPYDEQYRYICFNPCHAPCKQVHQKVLEAQGQNCKMRPIVFEAKRAEGAERKGIWGN